MSRSLPSANPTEASWWPWFRRAVFWLFLTGLSGTLAASGRYLWNGVDHISEMAAALRAKAESRRYEDQEIARFVTDSNAVISRHSERAKSLQAVWNGASTNWKKLEAVASGNMLAARRDRGILSGLPPQTPALSPNYHRFFMETLDKEIELWEATEVLARLLVAYSLKDARTSAALQIFTSKMVELVELDSRIPSMLQAEVRRREKANRDFVRESEEAIRSIENYEGKLGMALFGFMGSFMVLVGSLVLAVARTRKRPEQKIIITP